MLVLVCGHGELYPIKGSTTLTSRNLHVDHDAFLARKLEWYRGELSNSFHHVIPELCQPVRLLKVADKV